jgi:hypothetical protein
MPLNDDECDIFDQQLEPSRKCLGSDRSTRAIVSILSSPPDSDNTLVPIGQRAEDLLKCPVA